MARPACSFRPHNEEVTQLQQLLKGKHSVSALKRVQVLLALHQGNTPSALAQLVSLSPAMVYNIRNRYLDEGLTVALNEKPRPGQPSKFDKATQAHLTALACSEAPQGRSRWILRLLADRLVELRLVESISHQAVGEQLKKTPLSLGSSSSGVSPK
ncbi:helix-turn-helix domain-containing protein [Spirosoma fluminis]